EQRAGTRHPDDAHPARRLTGPSHHHHAGGTAPAQWPACLVPASRRPCPRISAPPGRMSPATTSNQGAQEMRVTQRGRRARIRTAVPAVVGGGGAAVGAAAFGPATAQPAPAVTGAPAPARAPATDGYTAVVREVLPSVVLIRTTSGLGSGVVLDTEGNIVT